MAKFLESVAQYLMSQTCDHRDALLVLPNKRAIMFMRRYMKRQMTGPVIMPRMQTIGAFFSSMTDLKEAPDVDRLFTLYDAYCSIYKGHPEFDKFRFWGQMLLDDFDDIDRQLVNARDVLTNVKNFDEIKVDFLDEDQRRVAREIWGYEPETFEGFKSNHRRKVNTDIDKADLVYDGYERLTSLLLPLYERYHLLLKEQGLTTRGMIARNAAESIEQYADMPGKLPEKIYFIGFGVLSQSEMKVFKVLRNLRLATFFWDIPEMLTRDLGPDIKTYHSPLAKYIARIVRFFPMPEEFSKPVSADGPKVSIIGVPGATLQAKVAGNVMDLLDRGSLIHSNRADNTVIVLPDTSLLIPLLHSLSASKVNVTMGVPIRNTPFATLLSLIIKMNLSSRVNSHGKVVFLTQDVLQILSHPSLTVLLPNETAKLRGSIEAENRFLTTYQTIEENASDLRFVFNPIADDHSAEGARNFIERLIDGMLGLLGEPSGEDVETKLERSRMHEHRVLLAMKKVIANLLDAIERHSHCLNLKSMNRLSFLRLVERQLNHEQLNFSGSPLSGIQIMGALETRSVDFDNVLMLSMNEKTFPPKNFLKSMLPSAIRAAYGLSTPETRELEYAWIYANLLSRSKKVFMFYNSASESKGRGGMSRYLLQTLYIYNRNKPEKVDLVPGGKLEPRKGIVIKKTEEVRNELARFRVGGDRNLSVSALEKYGECPLRFYLSVVKDVQESKSPEDAIDDMTLGSVVHNVLEDIYKELFKINGGKMSPSFEVTKQYVVDKFCEHLGSIWYQTDGMRFEDMPPEAKMHIEPWVNRIIRIIEAEKSRPETYWVEGCELAPENMHEGRYMDWYLESDLGIRFRFLIDRVDRLNDGSLRFVDYKTGRDALDVSDMDVLFWQKTDNAEPIVANKAIFQLLAYAHAYAELSRQIGKPHEGDIHLEITRVLDPENSIGVQLKVGDIPIEDYRSPVVQDFMPRFVKMVRSIFDPSQPFVQTEDDANCKYCQFRNICQRYPENN